MSQNKHEFTKYAASLTKSPPRPHHTRSGCDKLTIPDNLKNYGSIKDFPALRQYYQPLFAYTVTPTKLRFGRKTYSAEALAEAVQAHGATLTEIILG